MQSFLTLGGSLTFCMESTVHRMHLARTKHWELFILTCVLHLISIQAGNTVCMPETRDHSAFLMFDNFNHFYHFYFSFQKTMDDENPCLPSTIFEYTNKSMTGICPDYSIISIISCMGILFSGLLTFCELQIPISQLKSCFLNVTK